MSINLKLSSNFQGRGVIQTSSTSGGVTVSFLQEEKWEHMKSDSQISLLIEREAAFFSDALAAQASLGAEQKKLFRAETVAQRRERLSHELFQKMKGVVAHGKFAGLQLDPTPEWGKSDLSSMLLGCYEIEVMDALHADEFADRSHFVDIGAADGYYAIGGLLNGRFRTADCFELTEAGRETILRNAERNGVSDRLRVFGVADQTLPEVLADRNWSDTVVLCDIEGAEFDLLDTSCLSAMKGAMIIVEIHNWVSDFWPRYTALLDRASCDFSIRLIERSAFPSHPMPELRGMPDDNRMIALSEGRPNVMRFLQLVS